MNGTKNTKGDSSDTTKPHVEVVREYLFCHAGLGVLAA